MGEYSLHTVCCFTLWDHKANRSFILLKGQNRNTIHQDAHQQQQQQQPWRRLTWYFMSHEVPVELDEHNKQQTLWALLNLHDLRAFSFLSKTQQHYLFVKSPGATSVSLTSTWLRLWIVSWRLSGGKTAKFSGVVVEPRRPRRVEVNKADKWCRKQPMTDVVFHPCKVTCSGYLSPCHPQIGCWCSYDCFSVVVSIKDTFCTYVYSVQRQAW